MEPLELAYILSKREVWSRYAEKLASPGPFFCRDLIPARDLFSPSW